MIEIKYGVKPEADYKILVGNTDKMPKGLSGEHKELFKEFLKGEDDFRSVNGLNSSTFFIKAGDDAEKLRKAGAKVRAALRREVEKISIFGDDAILPVTEGFLLASYQFTHYLKEAEKKNYLLKTIRVEDSIDKEKVQELLNTVKAVIWARDMVNEPVSFLNAEQFAEEMVQISKDAGLDVHVLEKTQIESLKMGGLLAVNKGSIDPPVFTIIEYKGKKAKNKKPIVLVGKGVVYDTGGLSLKPTPGSMDSMKSDMAGAACMAGAIYLAALQKLPVHLIALIPCTDNRPGLNAYAPGDIITMFDGTTVEVLNTDAEGRMILADALAYSNKYDPELVIDAATLTGAAVRAIGTHASIIMGTADDSYFNKLEKAGNDTFERVVRFPFWDEYMEDMKSPIADLKNIGGANAGMITAGKFLSHFVKAPYIHMDIAGPSWLDSGSDYRPKGGTGAGIRLLFNFLKEL